MSKPSVAVIIPTICEDVSLLFRAVNSAVSKDSSLYLSIYIVFDGQDAEFPKKFREKLLKDFESAFKSITILKNSRTLGPAGARNTGVAASKEEFISFLDDDDEFLPGKTERQVNLMMERDWNFSHSNYLRSETGKEIRKFVKSKSLLSSGTASSIAFGDCLIATPTVMVRRSLIGSCVPLFEESLAVMEDRIAWLKIMSQSEVKYGHIKEALTIVHVRANSLQGSMRTSSTGQATIQMANLQVRMFAKSLGIREPLWRKMLKRVVYLKTTYCK